MTRSNDFEKKPTQAQAVILGGMIGDALGVGYEFVPSATRHKLRNDGYQLHPNAEWISQPGHYSDDTQQTIAVTKWLMKGIHTQALLADALVDEFHQGPEVGYSKGMRHLLDSCSTGADLIERIRPSRATNGAVMRVAPIGLLPEPKINELAKQSALLTHAAPADEFAVAMALLVHQYAYGEQNTLAVFANPNLPETSRNYLQNCLSDESVFRTTEHGVPMWAKETVGAVYHITHRYGHSYWKSLEAAIALGGDTDSVAGLVSSTMALKHGFSDLPAFVFQVIYDGPKGLTEILELAEEFDTYLDKRNTE